MSAGRSPAILALNAFVSGFTVLNTARASTDAPDSDFLTVDPSTSRTKMTPLGQFNGDLNVQAASILGAQSLSSSLRVNGGKVAVAVIGSGIDPGHKDLQRTPAGSAKITEWADFTDEGLVNTEPVIPSRGWVDTRFGRLKTGNLRSAGGALRVGVLREAALDARGALGQDLNGNGLTTDVFSVLVIDHAQKGVYSRVYVDTNQNRDFTDEVPVGAFGESGGFSRFRDKSGNVNSSAVHFVVAGISRDGSAVRLGFDSLGTGTFLAGLVAARGLQEGMNGVAPGATLIALKVLDSSGRGSWEAISQAIIHASRSGARVILVDTGLTILTDEHLQGLRELIADVVSRYNVVVLFAAGDGGPALESCKAPTDSVSAIAVGGATGPADAPGVWSRSAVGPTPVGGWAPDVLAPVSAASTVPTWFSRSGYALATGTAVSAAYAAGCSALLVSACDVAGVRPDARSALSALSEGGRRVSSATVIEQGGGVLDVSRAFDLLKAGFRAPMTVVAEDPIGHRDGGLFARGFVPGSARFYVDNFSGESSSMGFRSESEWVKPRQAKLIAPAVGERSLVFEYGDIPPGLQSTVVRGVDERTGRTIMMARHAVVRASPLPAGGTLWPESSAPLKPGEVRRQFVSVPHGCTELRVDGVNSGEEGAEIQVVGPGGKRAYMADLPAASRSVKVVRDPEAGVWEIVLFRDGGDRDVPVTLAVSSFGFLVAPWPPSVEYRPSDGSARVTFGLANYRANATIRLAAASRAERSGTADHEVIVVPRQHSFSRAFTVTEGTSRILASTCHPSSARADVDLYLHVFDPQTGWKEVASSAALGSSNERIDLKDPAPGSYMLFVESRDTGSDVRCELTLRAFKNDPAVTWDRQNPAYLEKDEALPASFDIPTPAGRPREMEVQVVDDSNGSLLASVPLVIAGDTDTAWSVELGGLAGVNSRFVTVKSARASYDPWSEIAVMINGRTHALEDGAVTLSVTVPSEVEITLLMRGKPIMSKTLVVKDLPPASAKTPEPSSDPEKEKLREGLIRRLGL
ncbi:MAG: S8 family serine peptidase [Firmicutes bacterium]|nr:S8 family serine peptidase [Bacillota bacterium]